MLSHYEIAIESANAELIAYETFNNFSSILNKDNTERVKESFGRIKNMIINFFKKISEAIVRFLVNLFGQTSRLMNKKGIDLIIAQFKKWTNDLNSLEKEYNKFLAHHKGESSTEFNQGEIDSIIAKMTDECNELDDDVTNTLFKFHEKEDYKVMAKGDIKFLDDFQNRCKTLTLNLHNETSTNNKTINVNPLDRLIADILKLTSLIESTSMKLINKCAWQERSSNDELKLKKPISFTVEFDD